MANSAIDVQVKTAYEDLGMSPEEISAELGIDKDAVVYSLSNHSAAFRKFVRDNEKANLSLTSTFIEDSSAAAPDVNREEAIEMLDIMKNIARESDDDGVRMKAATFVYNEHKGRNNVADKIGTGLSLGQLNAGIQKAIQMASAMKHAMPTIDVSKIEPAS